MYLNALSFHRNAANFFEEVLEICRICARIASILQSFKCTEPSEKQILKHRVQVDRMLLNGYPGVQMLDDTGNVFAALFLIHNAACKIWKSIEQVWSLLYLASRNFLFVNPGSAYRSEVSKKTAEASGVWPEETTIEPTGGTVVVAGYHAPLLFANVKKCANTYLWIDNKECYKLQYLQLAAPYDQKLYFPQCRFMGTL